MKTKTFAALSIIVASITFARMTCAVELSSPILYAGSVSNIYRLTVCNIHPTKALSVTGKIFWPQILSDTSQTTIAPGQCQIQQVTNPHATSGLYAVVSAKTSRKWMRAAFHVISSGRTRVAVPLR